jgi:hypothetical protein
MRINRMFDRTKKSIYVTPRSEVITLNVSGDIMENWGLGNATKRARAEDSWAKKYNWEPVAPDLGDMNNDDNDWDGQTHAPKMKSVWDD